MGFLDQILENFELLFWLLIVVGSSVASMLKKRAAARQAEQRDGRPSRPEVVPTPRPEKDFLEDLLEEYTPEEMPNIAPSEGSFEVPDPVLPPPPQRMPAQESLVASLAKGELQLGNLQATAAAKMKSRMVWRPTASWAEAIVLREILGPPRSLSDGDLPAFR